MAWVRTTLKPPREIIRKSNEIDEQQNEERESNEIDEQQNEEPESNDFEDDWFDEWFDK